MPNFSWYIFISYFGIDVDSVDTDDDDVVTSSDDDDDMVEDDVEEVDTSSLNMNLPDDSMSDLKLETYKQFLQELNMYDKVNYLRTLYIHLVNVLFGRIFATIYL